MVRVAKPRAVCLAGALLTVSCGRSATQPSGTTPSPPMAPGRYSLTVSISTNGMAGLQPPCTITSTPDLTGTLPMPVTSFFVTAVDDRVGGLVVRPDPAFDLGLEVRLRASASGVSGMARGVARDMAVPQSVSILGGEPGTDATLSGTFGFNLNDVGGPVSGRVVFDRGGVTYSCPFNNWVMNRRP